MAPSIEQTGAQPKRGKDNESTQGRSDVPTDRRTDRVISNPLGLKSKERFFLQSRKGGALGVHKGWEMAMGRQ